MYGNNSPYKYVNPDGRFIFTAIAIATVAYSAYDGYQEGGLSGAIAEASGFNDLKSSFNSVKNGDLSGAVANLAATVCKACKAVVKGSKGLTTPKKYFKNKTKAQVKKALQKKYGKPKSSRKHADTYYNAKTKRSFNVHEEPGHNDGKPHVDIRRRGNHEERKYDLKEDN
jgi:hypothetical protein